MAFSLSLGSGDHLWNRFVCTTDCVSLASLSYLLSCLSFGFYLSTWSNSCLSTQSVAHQSQPSSVIQSFYVTVCPCVRPAVHIILPCGQSHFYKCVDYTPLCSPDSAHGLFISSIISRYSPPSGSFFFLRYKFLVLVSKREATSKYAGDSCRPMRTPEDFQENERVSGTGPCN